jgi:predicted ATPase
MKLKFSSKYKSVDQSFEVVLPGFSVLTGRNGSGKTHILEAIKNGNITVENINLDQIFYFNYLDFAYNFQRDANSSQGSQAWRLVQAKSGGVDLFFNAENIVNGHKDEIEVAAKEKDKSIFTLAKEDISARAFLKLVEYKQSINSSINSSTELKSNETILSIYHTVIAKSKIFLGNLDRITFDQLYYHSALSQRNLISDLSNVFLRYFRNLEMNEMNKYKKKPFLSNVEFEKEYGVAPWDLVRNIFKGFDLNFDINDPYQDNTNPFDGSFTISFKNLDRGDKIIPFNDLSSGEKILLTLINAIYTSMDRQVLPKLILLDEIDGPLNSSMIESFIYYLSENFVANDINIMIATHSPSTVAFSPEDSIYIVNTSEQQPLVKKDKQNAVLTLSDGYITLSDLLSFSTLTKDKIIISEGKNYKYLNEAIPLFYTHNDYQILEIKDLGTGQLRALFDFIRVFSNEKNFIFIWDCDYRFKDDNITTKDLSDLKAKAIAKNRVFIFDRNSNGFITRGIENIFDKSDCTTYQGTYTSDSVDNKARFQRFILGKQDKTNVFKNIKPFTDFMRDTSKFHNI